MMLAQLLASMKDDGRVTIEGFFMMIIPFFGARKNVTKTLTTFFVNGGVEPG
jgi:hypothetical protein